MRLAGIVLWALIRSASGQQPVNEPNWITEPFDPSVAQLSGEFGGHSCDAVVSAINDLKLVKGEFETSAQFAKRAENQKDAKLLGSIGFGNTVAFVAWNFTGRNTTYDADAGTLAVTYPALNREGRTLVPVRRISHSETDEILTNRLGATVKVRNSFTRSCSVFLPPTRSGELISERIAMPPERAAIEKDAVALLFVGRLLPGPIIETRTYSPADFSNPFSFSSHNAGPAIADPEVWIFNKRTGTIYRKIKI